MAEEKTSTVKTLVTVGVVGLIIGGLYVVVSKWSLGLQKLANAAGDIALSAVDVVEACAIIVVDVLGVTEHFVSWITGAEDDMRTTVHAMSKLGCPLNVFMGRGAGDVGAYQYPGLDFNWPYVSGNIRLPGGGDSWCNGVYSEPDVLMVAVSMDPQMADILSGEAKKRLGTSILRSQVDEFITKMKTLVSLKLNAAATLDATALQVEYPATMDDKGKVNAWGALSSLPDSMIESLRKSNVEYWQRVSSKVDTLKALLYGFCGTLDTSMIHHLPPNIRQALQPRPKALPVAFSLMRRANG